MARGRCMPGSVRSQELRAAALEGDNADREGRVILIAARSPCRPGVYATGGAHTNGGPMNPRFRIGVLLSLLLLLPALLSVDCTSWRRQNTSTQEILAAKHRRAIRVSLADSRHVTLTQPWIANDSLFGLATTFPPQVSGKWVGGHTPYRVAIPLESVQKVELRRFSAGKTFLLVMGLGITVGIIGAIIASGDNETSTYSPPPSSGGGSDDGYVPSCPLIFSWDGAQWHLDAGTYAGAIMPALARSVVDNLDHARDEDGVVRVRLTGLSSETEHVDALALFAVDHAPGVMVVPDGEGALHTVTEMVAPIHAWDFSNRDALPRVAKADEWCWESEPRERDPGSGRDLRDGLEIEFPRPAGAREARLVVDATNTPWAAHLMREVVALRGTKVQAWYDAAAADPARARRIQATFAREAFLRVLMWGSKGWELQGLVWEAGPEVLKRQVVVLDVSHAEGETVRVRLESTPNLWLVDRVAIDYTPERNVGVTPLRSETARDLAGRDVRRLLEAVDHAEYVIAPTDTAEITFRVPAVPAGRSRTYLARTEGWYHIDASAAGEPDAVFLDRLETEPGEVARFAVTRMNQALAAMEQQARSR